jgi:hypothetical protein
VLIWTKQSARSRSLPVFVQSIPRCARPTKGVSGALEGSEFPLRGSAFMWGGEWLSGCDAMQGLLDLRLAKSGNE